ncbi:SusC/RagA family TonB-linked outer membrane protein [Pontibacter sp. 13R65]|uniref:SusC/RagA family TonB-linked outer membrane protein n=1 Tax=Pontibacter sp. 13R65 TaxID=3127458 RepID=UPI00301BE2C9
MKKKFYKVGSYGLLMVFLSATWQSGQAQGLALKKPSQTNAGTISKTITVKVKDALHQLREHYKADILFSDQVVRDQAVPDNSINLYKTLEQNLDAVLKQSDLDYKKSKDGSYLITPAAKRGKSTAPEAAVTSRNANSVIAQNDVTITGQVTDEKGGGLPGVTVLLKGTTIAAPTDIDGRYSLQAPNTQNDAILVFSYVGYTTQEISIGNRSVVNVTLQSDAKALGEVVVIGYGTQRREDVTSAVASVGAEDFVKAPVLDAGQLIQGKVAGMTVSAPSGDPTANTQILLRGNSTLFGANADPLVLIDGIPGNLRTVAPEDIESIDVLKDGSAAAIYGVRGTNGVILITTKRAKGNINTIDYSASVSTQTIARKLDILTADDYRQQIAAGLRDPASDQGHSTDWLDEITRTPVSHIHNLTFRGGTDKTNYLVSLNYRGLQGIFARSDNSTFTGRADVNHSMLDDKLQVNIGLLNQNNWFTQTVDGGSFSGYTYRQAIQRNPTAPTQNVDGTWNENTGILNYENPLARIYETNGLNRNANTRVNATIAYTPLEGLRLSALMSYSKYHHQAGYSETKQHISNTRDNLNGYAATGSQESIDRLMELTGQYTRSFNDHTVTLLGGYSYQDNDFFDSWMRNYDFPSDLFSYYNIGLGNALQRGLATMYSNKATTNLIGFFGRVTYNYKDKYLLMANLRHEAASQLYGAEKPWGTFPAVSLGWRISNEGFMADQNLFDELKLRVGYGVTGSQPSTGFLGVALLGYGNFVYSNGRWIQSLGPTQNPNPNLRWEEKHESNLGLDFSIMKGRISGNIDVYNRQIRDLLYDYQVPSPPNLFPSTRANVGTMENRGLEVLLNVVPVQTKDFEWVSSFIFSTNSNKLKSLSNDIYQTTSDYFTEGFSGVPIQTFTHIVKIGQNIGDFYGFKVIDVSEDGKWIYEGRNGEPVAYSDFNHAFEDKKVLGNGLPKYYGGWNNNFRYKNLDLGVTMRGAFDYQVLNFQRMYYENRSAPYFNSLRSATEPVFGKVLLDPTVAQEFNSYYIEDGDFWKVDNITLGYNFNINSKFVRSARIHASSLNSFIITGYKGIDPEVNRLGLAPGNDSHEKYPTTRTFTLGVNVSF